MYGLGTLVIDSANNSMARKYFDDYSNTDEFKDSYYYKLQEDPRFSYKKNPNMTKAERKHVRDSWNEQKDTLEQYAKQRSKEAAQAKKDEFLEQFNKFQPNNLGYLMHGK